MPATKVGLEIQSGRSLSHQVRRLSSIWRCNGVANLIRVKFGAGCPVREQVKLHSCLAPQRTQLYSVDSCNLAILLEESVYFVASVTYSMLHPVRRKLSGPNIAVSSSGRNLGTEAVRYVSYCFRSI